MELVDNAQKFSMQKDDDIAGAKQEIVSFFESFSWEHSLFLLRESKDIVVQQRFGSMEYSIEEDNLRFFFEKLEKLLEAAWMIGR